MANYCIPKIQSEALIRAAKAGEVSIERLMKMSPEESSQLFAKILGKEDGKQVSALFQKALISTQKSAMKNWVWKNFYTGKPLYAELGLGQSKALRDAGVSVKDLKKMSSEQRIAELSKYVNEKVANKLNARFETQRKSGNLANWEERVIGTREMFENNRLKGAFARIEVLNDIGLLAPKQTADFMEDLVSMKLGIDVTAEQSANISRRATAVTESFENLKDDWTYTNKKAIYEYFQNRKALENYVQKLDPSSAFGTFIELGARGALLLSLRSLMNSALFQVVPGITRLVVKRLGTALMVPGDFTKLNRLQGALSGSSLSKAERTFIYEQAKMGIQIYRKTGYDISRMESLKDGFNFFGEKFSHLNGPTFKEAKGVQEMMGAGVRAHAKLMYPGLKYMAGGTDTIFANLHRADTTSLLAKIIAKNEAKAGLLPKGVSQEDRVLQLMRESYSFNPQSEQAKYIREMGILDAHYANGTQNEIYGAMAIKLRDAIQIGDVSPGKALIPFLKIPANMLGTGLEATGPGLIIGATQVFKGLRMTERGATKSATIAKGLSKMTASGGLLGSAIFLTALLDPDDFVGAYDWRARSENKLTESKNAGSSYIRIGGKWYSTRWLGPMAIPVNALMYSRQAKARGDSATVGYAAGIFAGVRDFPGLKEVTDLGNKALTASTADDPGKLLKALGLDFETTSKWVTSRALPSFVVYDIMGLRNETKYDALGRPVPKRGDSVKNAVGMSFFGANLKEDTSNSITKEFDRLLRTGNLPVLTEPSKKLEEAGIAQYGEEGYTNRLNKLKKDYAQEVMRTIESGWYKRLTPEEKKKEIDNIRKREILDRL